MQYLTARLEARTQRGEKGRVAKALKMHSSHFSQVLSGTRDLTIDQAFELGQYFEFSDHEMDYWISLVEKARCGNPRSKAYFERKTLKLKKGQMQIGTRLQAESEITESDRAVFYSNWIYSAVRNLCAIEGLHTIEVISEKLKQPRRRIQQASEFLIRTGLCIESPGKLRIGPRSTHIPSESPLVVNHHLNWRLKSIQKLDSGEHSKNDALYKVRPESDRFYLTVVDSNFSDLKTFVYTKGDSTLSYKGGQIHFVPYTLAWNEITLAKRSSGIVTRDKLAGSVF